MSNTARLIYEGPNKILPKVSFELSKFRQLAIPMFFSQLAGHATGIIAALMTGNYSTIDQAAVATGNMFFFPISMGLMGTLFIVTAMVAQNFGANTLDNVGKIIRQSFWVSIPLIILGIWAMSQSSWAFNLLGTPEEVREITRKYMYGLMVGLPALYFFQPLRSMSEGITKPLPITYINLFMVAVNAILNYGFIFGKFGLPELGGAGCGISFAVSAWLSLIILATYIYTSDNYKDCGLFDQFDLPDFKIIKEIVILGLPIGGTLFVEISMFSGSGLILGQLGADVIASHSIAMHVSTVTFMIPLAIGLAASVRVGNLVGANASQDSRFAAFCGIGFSIALAFINAAILILYGEYLASFFNPNSLIISLASTLLIVAAIFQITDGIAFSGMGALRGYKDTRVPLLIMIIAYWVVGMPLGYNISLTDNIIEPIGALGMCNTCMTSSCPEEADESAHHCGEGTHFCWKNDDKNKADAKCVTQADGSYTCECPEGSHEKLAHLTHKISEDWVELRHLCEGSTTTPTAAPSSMPTDNRSRARSRRRG